MYNNYAYNYYDYELYHHGIKGMHWGVRRFQYKDGSLTDAGRRRYADGPGSNSSSSGTDGVAKRSSGAAKPGSVVVKRSTSAASGLSSATSTNKPNSTEHKTKDTTPETPKERKGLTSNQKKVIAVGASVVAAYGAYKFATSETGAKMMGEGKYLIDSAKTKITGKQYVDTYLEQGTTFARIQTNSEFENHAFYATYKQQDMDKYQGLFGKNLRTRAEGEATRAEKLANKTGKLEDLENAKKLREYSDGLDVYQLKLDSTKKLKIPSDDNATRITIDLLKEKDFKDNLVASIVDSKGKMKRPQQQMLFKQAERALQKDPSRMSNAEKSAIYKAFNLSLVHHNQQEIAAQNRFYQELKKNGYSALLDLNDKSYSSYHAKRPMIVFDTDAVKLQSVTKTDPKVVDKLYKKYNTERIAKESIASTLGIVSHMGRWTYDECTSYVSGMMKDYLS